MCEGLQEIFTAEDLLATLQSSLNSHSAAEHETAALQ